MNPICRVLDARGLPCPQPLILARKALAEGGFDMLEITVDDPASRENLLKFAAYAKCQVEEERVEGAQTRLRLTPSGASSPQAGEIPTCASAPEAGRAAVVLIVADGIGQGDLDLARLLMRGFLYTLTESEQLPRRVILMNSGVRLAIEGSGSLANLKKLEDRGVEVLSCGTCLEFYKLTDTLAVGGITNMYEIAGHLLEGPTVSIG